MSPVNEIDETQYIFNSLGKEGRRQIIEHRVEPQVFLRGQAIVERLVLEYKADALPHFIWLGYNVEAGDRSSAASWFQKRRKDLDRRGFSSSVRPQKAKDLTRLHIELNTVNGCNVAEFLHQVFHMNDIHEHLMIIRLLTRSRQTHAPALVRTIARAQLR